MAQIIGIIIGIIALVWVFAALVWIIQWMVAGFVWIYQVVLMPFFVYFSPAILVLSISIGIFLGSGIAAKNYFSSLINNVTPLGTLKNIIRYYIITILTLVLFSIYSTFALTSGSVVYYSAIKFGKHVYKHYSVIKFPAFDIHFPFWKD